jgi:hypothetical protein
MRKRNIRGASCRKTTITDLAERCSSADAPNQLTTSASRNKSFEFGHVVTLRAADPIS